MNSRSIQKMSNQEIRAAALQASATFLSSKENVSIEQVIETADVFVGYISRGSDLVPLESNQQTLSMTTLTESSGNLS